VGPMPRTLDCRVVAAVAGSGSMSSYALWLSAWRRGADTMHANRYF
jgi:hypothetical protein